MNQFSSLSSVDELFVFGMCGILLPEYCLTDIWRQIEGSGKVVERVWVEFKNGARKYAEITQLQRADEL